MPSLGGSGVDFSPAPAMPLVRRSWFRLCRDRPHFFRAKARLVTNSFQSAWFLKKLLGRVGIYFHGRKLSIEVRYYGKFQRAGVLRPRHYRLSTAPVRRIRRPASTSFRAGALRLRPKRSR